MQYKKKGLILFLLAFLAFQCQVPEAQKDFTGDSQFRTTDPSRLYFKNMRASHYYNRRKPNTKIDLYTLRKFSNDHKRPILYPVIVNNWLQDEAYVFIEKNKYAEFTDTLDIMWKTDTLSEGFQLALFNKANQYEFAGRLYEKLLNNEELHLKNKNGKWVPIFQNRADRLHFLSTMRDYYRLTEVF